MQFVNNWYSNTFRVLEPMNPFIRFCWLRTICGGWTTSIRMHAEVPFSKCIFACAHSEDCLTHYLCCPVLWCLAREISGLNETSVSIESRLSLVNPTPAQFTLLAMCHSIYHLSINDKECIALHLAGDQASLQRRLVSFGRQLSQMIR